jgi:hypothetical protein
MDNNNDKLKVEFALPTSEEWEQITCPICKSPFHEEKDCPQSRIEEPKFKFRTRKEMGLEQGSLPFKFRVDIDPQVDDEVEVTRKRALLRLNSSKVYNLMGLSVKAQESQKAALQWLVRLADELDIEDEALQKERGELLPLIQTLQEAFQFLTRVRQNKIKQAEAMEEVATKARSGARKVRARIMKKKAVEKEFWVLRLPDSNVDVPIIYGEDIDPANLFKEAADAILEKEKSKQLEHESEDEG